MSFLERLRQWRGGEHGTRARAAGERAAAVAARAAPLLVVAFTVYLRLVGLLVEALIGLAALLAGPGRRMLAVAGSGVARLSRIVTPVRALALVVAGAAVLLALSQYADYRGVAIGTDDYAQGGVAGVAPAPEIDRQQAGEAHAYALVPVALASLLLLAAAMNGRWRLCRLISLAGIAAIAVAVLIDRPAGLDPEGASLAYASVEASLLEGFYAEISAGALLAASSLLLARELRRAGAAGAAQHDGRRTEGDLVRRLRGRGAGVRGVRA